MGPSKQLLFPVRTSLPMSGQSSIQPCPTVHFLARLDIETRHCQGWRRTCTWRLNKEMGSALQDLSSIRAEFCCMSRPRPWAPEQVLWGFEFLQCETPWPRLSCLGFTVLRFTEQPGKEAGLDGSWYWDPQTEREGWQRRAEVQAESQGFFKEAARWR